MFRTPSNVYNVFAKLDNGWQPLIKFPKIGFLILLLLLIHLFHQFDLGNLVIGNVNRFLDYKESY